MIGQLKKYIKAAKDCRRISQRIIWDAQSEFEANLLGLWVVITVVLQLRQKPASLSLDPHSVQNISSPCFLYLRNRLSLQSTRTSAAMVSIASTANINPVSAE